MASQLHRYVGLLLGVWLTMMGLTGATLVFHKEIDSALNARMMRVEHITPAPDLDALAEAVRRRYPDRALLFFERYGLSDFESYPFVLSDRRPMTADGPDLAGLHDPEEAAALEVFVDPRSGAILGARPYRTLLRSILSLHEELLTPAPGRIVVGAAGFITVISVIAGVIVWVRLNGRKLGRALKLSLKAPTPKLMRDLHLIVGIYVALFLTIQALSGALINTYFPLTRWIGGMIAPAKAPPSLPVHASAAPRGPLIGANQARDIGLSLHPASDPVQIVFPLPQKNTWSVRIFPRDQAKTRHLRQALISPTGEILFQFDPDSLPYPHRIPAAFSIWIHNGQFWGLPGRMVVLATGLSLMLFFPTGLYLWLRRRKTQRAMRR